MVVLFAQGQLSAQPGDRGISVSPVQALLSAKAPTQTLTLRNRSDKPIRFQLRAFAWQEGSQGETKLTTTKDILFFPRLLVVGPREERKIRIGCATPFASVEKSYRVVLNQLPPLERTSEQSQQVMALLRISIPIFLQPARPFPQGQVDGLTVEHSRFSFQVRNTGNVHLRVQSIRVKGLGLSGNPAFDRQVAGWYVLPGGVRVYRMEIPKAECAAMKSLTVEAKSQGISLNGQIEMRPGSCAVRAKTKAGLVRLRAQEE